MKEQVNLGAKGSFSVNKGGLHRALGVPEGNKIPAGKLAGAAHSRNPHVRRMAASAKGFKAMHHGKKHFYSDEAGKAGAAGHKRMK